MTPISDGRKACTQAITNASHCPPSPWGCWGPLQCICSLCRPTHTGNCQRPQSRSTARGGKAGHAVEVTCTRTHARTHTHTRTHTRTHTHTHMRTCEHASKNAHEDIKAGAQVASSHLEGHTVCTHSSPTASLHAFVCTAQLPTQP